MRIDSLFWPALGCALLAVAAPHSSVGQPRLPHSAAAAPPDSARLSRRLHRLGEVRVRALGPEQFAMGSTRFTADSATLSQFRTGTVADLLQAAAPLYLKSYGPGQLATIALRGTSAQHTAVLWNGLNIMLPTLGQNDFALLPVGANTQLTVQPGPSAALYGSGAIGGAVLLSSAPDWRPGLRGSVQGDVGSFGLRGGSLEAEGTQGALAVRVAASYRAAQNNYPYFSPEFGGPMRRTLTSAALRHQWSIAPEVAWRAGAAGLLTASAWLTDADRDIQAAVGTTDRHAREQDQSRRLVLGYRRSTAASGQWLVRGAWFEDILNYRDDGLSSRSRVRTTQAQAEYSAPLGAHGSLRVGAEAQHFAANVAEYGAAVVAENRGAAFVLLRFDPRPQLRLTANLRQAALPQAWPLTPTAGLEWDLLAPAATSDSLAHRAAHRLTAKASVARSYRAPTLNERFWQVGGNPNLRPETGFGYEVGLVQQSALGSLKLRSELTGYHQIVDDWVQWAPGPDGLWRPRNLRQVLTQGLEASSRATARRGRHSLSIGAQYAYTWAYTHRATAADPVPAGLPLPYVPAHTAAASLEDSWRAWRIGARATFTSYRYTDAGGVAYLPGYGLLSSSLGYVLRLPGQVQALLLVQGTNLLNQAYDSYEGRPAPPRAVQASLRLDWH